MARVIASLLVVCALLPAQVPPKKKPKKQPPTDAQLIASFEKTPLKSQTKRAQVASQISARTSPVIREWLMGALPKEKQAAVRVSMVRGLSRTPDLEVLKVLDKAFASSTHYSERITILAVYHKFPFDWRRRLVKIAAEEKNASVRRYAPKVLARGKDRASLKALRRVRDEHEELTGACVDALAGNYPVNEVFSEWLAPHLTPNADTAVRTDALRVLAVAKDARFHRYARSLAQAEKLPFRLGTWIGLAGGFGDFEALWTMVVIAEEGGDAVQRYLERNFLVLKGEKVSEWIVTRGLSHNNPMVRSASLGLLRKHPDPRAAKPLMALARKKADPQLARDAVETLGALSSNDVAKFLRKLWSRKDALVAAEAVAASFSVEKGSPEVVKDVMTVARRSRSWEMRLTAMNLLKHAHAMACFDIFKDNAKHKRTQVRSVAYDALTWVRTKECVDFLISRVDQERGRARFDLVDALLDLTGFDYGINKRTWSDWWSRVRDDYTLPKKPKTKRRSAPPAGYASYYGITVRSNRIVFVIDTSGSMSPTGTGTSKIQKAKDNLIAVLKTFDKSTRYNVIAFGSNVRPFERQLLRATRGGRDKGIKWVNGLTTGGGTNIYDAMVMALDTLGVDTVFLLSDGAPSGGAVSDMNEIIRRLTARNKFRRVRINTIGIQVAGATASFMKRLAEQNFGEFVSR